jgi:hypothetical protein
VSTPAGDLAGDPAAYAARDDWQDAWQPMVEAVGTEFGDGGVVYGADRVEAGLVRRYVEPLELGSPLHHDAEVARAHGYPDVIAPYTSLLMFAVGPMWRPGDPSVFTSAERDGQPARSPVSERRVAVQPFTSDYFAVDLELDFTRPAAVGEQVGRRRSQRLISCVPKETRVGRGAFLTWESELVSDAGDVLVRLRTSVFSYVPHARKGSS